MRISLNSTIKKDTFAIDENDHFYLRLHKNAEIAWLILVPKTKEIEIFQLDNEFQQAVLTEINHLSALLKDKLPVDKLNIATLGNVVEQLHIHIIGRFHHDAYWPNPVWGQPGEKSYDNITVECYRQLFKLSTTDFVS